LLYAVGVFGFWGIWLGVVLLLFRGDDMATMDVATMGQFGDLFGGINALFTGLAFAGVVYTIFLQRHDLRTQNEELRATREAQIQQVKELEAAQRAQNQQVRLTIIATLGDIYMRQRDIMERGGFRERLWKAQKARDADREDGLDDYERASFEAWVHAREESDLLLSELEEMRRNARVRKRE
jgi:hypothetical protein